MFLSETRHVGTRVEKFKGVFEFEKIELLLIVLIDQYIIEVVIFNAVLVGLEHVELGPKG